MAVNFGIVPFSSTDKILKQIYLMRYLFEFNDDLNIEMYINATEKGHDHTWFEKKIIFKRTYLK